MKWYRRLPPAPRGFCNSSAIFRNDDYHLEFCRPGIALWGGNPTPETTNPMRSVVNLKVKVLQVRELDENQAVGYGGTWKAKRKSKIATIALGYADGWLRSLSNSGKLIIKGHEVPYVGRVSMDAITVDITDLPGKPLKAGDMLVQSVMKF